MNQELTQLNNLQEHLRVTKENLQIVNVELASSLQAKDSAEEETKNLLVKLNESSEELKLINKRINESSASETVIINGLQLRKKNLEVSNETLEQNIKDLNNKSSALTNIIDQLSDEISRLESVKLLILDEIENNIFEKESIINKIEEFNKTKLALEDEIKLKQLELSEYDIKFAKIEKEYQDRIKEIAILIQEEVDKIKNPMKLLEETKIALEKREKNLLILTTRFRNKFETAFPGKQVII